MSRSDQLGLDTTSHGMLVCKPPDDDVAQSLEIDLLKQLGFSEDILQVSWNHGAGESQERKSNENKLDFPEVSLLADSSFGMGLKIEQTITSFEEDDKRNSITSRTEQPTPTKEVRELYDRAKACYTSGDLCDCIIHIEEALRLSESTVSDHVLLRTLQAKVFNSMKDHLEALRTVAKIKSSDRSMDLTMEGGIALERMGLLFTAEQWLKRIILDRQEKTEECPLLQAAFKLFQDVRNRRIYGPLTKGIPVTISGSKNGRGLFTTKSFAKGETIFSELPEFLEQSLASQSITACANCGLSLARPEDVLAKEQSFPAELQKAVKKFWPKRRTIPCQACSRVMYCSEECRSDAWHGYHRVICPSSTNSALEVLYDVKESFRSVPAADGSSWQGWWNAEFSPVLLARIWASMLVQAKLRAQDEGCPSVDDWLTVSTQCEKYSSACEIQRDKQIPKTFEVMKNIFKRSKFLRYDITAADFNRKYHTVLMNYISFRDPQSPGKEFQDRIRRDKKMCKKIGKYMKAPYSEAEFHGLFPLACCINHSCLPNAEIQSQIVDGKPGIVVMATRDIQVMEEVMIAYVDTRSARRERREFLFRRYRFWCQCIRCLHEGDGPYKCSYCGKQAQKSVCSRENGAKEDQKDPLNKTKNSSSKCEIENVPEESEYSVSDTEATEPMGGKSEHRETDERNSLCSASASASANTLVHNSAENGLKEKSTRVINDEEHSQSCRDLVGGRNPAMFTTVVTRESGKSAKPGQTKTLAKEVGVVNMSAEASSDTTSESQGRFPHCKNCGMAWYCSKNCQKEAWRSGHKKICGKFAT